MDKILCVNLNVYKASFVSVSANGCRRAVIRGLSRFQLFFPGGLGCPRLIKHIFAEGDYFLCS